MGGWSVYCAICGGPFSSNLNIDPEDTDEFCYRDQVLRNCKLEWLDEVCGLGINPDAPGNDRSFVSGVGSYWDYGHIKVLSPGDDPNEPFRPDHGNNGHMSLTTYTSSASFFLPFPNSHNYDDRAEGGMLYVFPFHPICYKDILQRCVHQERPENIHGKILFDTMKDLSAETNNRLGLNYGDPEPPAEQIWHSTKGQEVLVVNPISIPQLKAGLHAIMDSLDQKTALAQATRNEDIFDRLPPELRHHVFEFLPVGSVLAVKAASLAMHNTSLKGGSWKHRLTSELPWLWEIHDIDLFQSQEMEEKASNLLVEIGKKSEYTSKNDDYIFGLANRRRIWGVCERIRSRYLERLKGVPDIDSLGPPA